MKSEIEFEQAKRFENELGQCMKCGYCTFWCPIYQEEPVETSVARGKHTMIKEFMEGERTLNKELEDLLSKCTLCMNCSEHCLFKVKTASVILGMRADKTKYQGIRFPYNIIFRYLLPRRTLFGRVVRVASWFQKMFMPKTQGTIRHLSFFLSALGKGRNIPSIAPQFLRQMVPVVNRPPKGVDTKMRVGFFSGCMMEFVYPDLGKRTIDFLTKQGVEVVLPEEQGCCGAPAYLGAGDFETGRKLADANIKAFADVDYVIAGCATCTSALKEYVKFLVDTPERGEGYDQFAGKVKDLSQFLVDVLHFPDSPHPVSPKFKGLRVTWHDPCHLVRYLGIKDEPRRIIHSLQGLDYTEMIRADWCCGMAGTFSIAFYDLSKKITERKLETIKATGADVVATSCPGCMVQLMDNMIRHKMPQRVVHLIELLE